MKAAEFFKEVKSEVSRVVWPSKKEAATATAMVVFMAALFGVFFLVVDSAVYKIIQFILGL